MDVEDGRAAHRGQRCDARGTALLDELSDIFREEISWSMPKPISDKLRKLYPERHTILAWEKRARHAHNVWWDKYGPYSEQQADYEVTLFDYVLTESAGNRGKLHGLMEDLVNHENVDRGFKARAQGIVFLGVKEILGGTS